MEDCGYTKSIRDLQEFCHAHEATDGPSRCTPQVLVRNFYQRAFNFYGFYNRITKKYFEFNTEDSHDVYLDSLYIGRELGNAIRILFSFTKWWIYSYYKIEMEYLPEKKRTQQT